MNKILLAVFFLMLGVKFLGDISTQKGQAPKKFSFEKSGNVNQEEQKESKGNEEDVKGGYISNLNPLLVLSEAINIKFHLFCSSKTSIGFNQRPFTPPE